jgi:hypothetical protein
VKPHKRWCTVFAFRSPQRFYTSPLDREPLSRACRHAVLPSPGWHACETKTADTTANRVTFPATITAQKPGLQDFEIHRHTRTQHATQTTNSHNSCVFQLASKPTSIAGQTSSIRPCDPVLPSLRDSRDFFIIPLFRTADSSYNGPRDLETPLRLFLCLERSGGQQEFPDPNSTPLRFTGPNHRDFLRR